MKYPLMITIPHSHSLTLLALIILCALITPCCGPEKTAQPTPQLNNALDLGQDWDRSQATPQRANAPNHQSNAASQAQWTIVLGTFTGDDHAQQARIIHQQITAALPQLRAAEVRSTERGSMLIFGRYPAADDTRAKSDLEQIKETTFNDLPVFARAFLSPLPRQQTTTARTSSPFDLMRVREQYPNVHPLYTLQVALWSDFDSGAMSLPEVRRRAEEYAQQLRQQGFDAYVYHDDVAKHSLVTVGLFNRTAVDASTGEFSPEVRNLMRRFPHHLVNGEELHEPISRHRPSDGTRPQRTFLVIVPRS